mgnify:CR=1 FL=1
MNLSVTFQGGTRFSIASGLHQIVTDQPIDDAFGLFPAVVVEFHTRRSTGQGMGSVGRRPPVPQ